MKLKYKVVYYFTGIFLLAAAACTDLSETVYDQVVTENYYNTKDDIIRAVFRPFEHGYWSITRRQTLNEETTDQIGTWSRDGWWVDGQVWQRMHYHTWTIDDGICNDEWEACYTSIMQINSVLDDFKSLNPANFGLTKAEFDNFEAQGRVMRAWFYIRLLDAYRNISLAVSKDPSLNSSGQVSPQEVFNFIESELKDAITLLPAKEGNSGNGARQGQWNKAGAASLLVRLYLNAEKWIGQAKYTEATDYAQKIINGEYGYYALGATWDEVFDWNNETSNEVIFGFPGTYGRSHWHYDWDVYWWCLPVNAHFYMGSQRQGDFNPKYGCQPSLDIEGNPYQFELGMTVHKFKKYPEDYRLKCYVNLGNSTREGMFLYGYLEYKEGNVTKRVVAPTGGYDLYIRDQVGIFHDTPPGEIPENRTSDMKTGDHNSGWHFAKYPIYGDDDAGKRESDYAEIRLAEIYYSLAECKFRAGNTEEAGKLLNKVRKRNYPEAYHEEYLYQPDGKTVLTENELIDEWGREFLAEGRRRTDLVRWNKFSTGSWWDKQPDSDTHTEIMSLSRRALNSDPMLKQNPGYEDITR
jgi:hypothetical protein